MICIAAISHARAVSPEGFARSCLAYARSVLSPQEAGAIDTILVTRTWLYRRFGPRLTRSEDLDRLLSQVEHKVDGETGLILISAPDCLRIIEEAKAKKAVGRGNRRDKQQRDESVSS